MNEALIGAFRGPLKIGALGCSLVSLLLNPALWVMSCQPRDEGRFKPQILLIISHLMSSFQDIKFRWLIRLFILGFVSRWQRRKWQRSSAKESNELVRSCNMNELYEGFGPWRCSISLPTKLRVYNAYRYILPVLLYGSDTRNEIEVTRRRLDASDQWRLRLSHI